MSQTSEPLDHPMIQKIDLLNSEAWKIRVSDTVRALELSEEAFSLSNKIDYPHGRAVSQKLIGFASIRRAEFSLALETLAEPYAFFLNHKDHHNLAVLHEYLGIAQRGLGNYEESLIQLHEALELARETGLVECETLALYHLSITYKYLGDLEKALEHNMLGLPIAEKLEDRMPESYHLHCIGSVYFEMDNLDDASFYFGKSLALREEIGDLWGQAGSHDYLGKIYLKKESHSQAKLHCATALKMARSVEHKKGVGNALYDLGQIELATNHYERAHKALLESLAIRESLLDKRGQAETSMSLGFMYLQAENSSQSRVNAAKWLGQALVLAKKTEIKDIEYKAMYALAEVSKQEGNYKLALEQLEKASNLEKEVMSQNLKKRLIHLEVSNRVSASKKEAHILKTKNEELTELIQLVEAQKLDLQETLSKLQSTQTQLIHSEKMASLGELTAGIAHEIQNPLNFVNNFSEVSGELLVEVEEELADGNIDDASEIISDLKENLIKINHHGGRASSIVKGMLDHSRATSGEKTPSDINAICDEYLRLAYHGFRAKDKFFQANFKTELDPNLPLVPVVSQDIGRVILNLINNAFYTVDKKTKGQDSNSKYQPEVKVSTKLFSYGPVSTGASGGGKAYLPDKQGEDVVQIAVQDNGQGMPPEVTEKIFQPFFTTKPTGKGTGLGLSLSYDIITKGHGGTLEVESEEGMGTEFVIKIPVKKDFQARD